MLDEALLRQATQENWAVSYSADAQSQEITRQNMAYHWSQAFGVIRDLLNQSYSAGIGRDRVIRHYDVTGKLCPLYFVEHLEAWEAFLADVRAY